MDLTVRLTGGGAPIACSDSTLCPYNVSICVVAEQFLPLPHYIHTS